MEPLGLSTFASTSLTRKRTGVNNKMRVWHALYDLSITPPADRRHDGPRRDAAGEGIARWATHLHEAHLLELARLDLGSPSGGATVRRSRGDGVFDLAHAFSAYYG